MKKFTVFFDQRNRTNYQVLAKDKKEAAQIGRRLYETKKLLVLNSKVQEGWIKESDGEDK